jgi:hypothetical protein
MQRNKSNMLLGAALVGGLYWASKQPGGIQGVWGRFSDKVKQVTDSSDPLGTLKGQINEARYKNSDMPPAPMDASHSTMGLDNGPMVV